MWQWYCYLWTGCWVDIFPLVFPYNCLTKLITFLVQIDHLSLRGKSTCTLVTWYLSESVEKQTTHNSALYTWSTIQTCWDGCLASSVKCWCKSTTRPSVHLAFQVQNQDQAKVSKWMISGLFPIICSRKLDFVYMVNVVLDLKLIRLKYMLETIKYN